MLRDTHAHLDDAQFNQDVPGVIDRAKAAGMDFILDPGCDEATSAQAVALSEHWDIVYAAVGFHPSDCEAFDPDRHLPMLTRWCQKPKTLAIGEIGLDYHYDDGAPKALQQKVFATQMELAGNLGLPVIIHDRDAHGDSLAMVQAHLNRETSGVFHSYSGSVETARQIFDLGMMIAIGGPLTFKNARKTPDVVAYAPLDRLLIETDSPYMAPVPRRGQRNEPSFVRLVAEKMAAIKKLDVETVIEATAANAQRLFQF
ncbi:MAG: TatD family hydrolase [Eubacteriaceae bacterium]|nr:TatD family hydrolase [Eubacteriaceae bacterium]MDD4508362.1 TatD family hydrolase [Eubacteriaceae bacterium]